METPDEFVLFCENQYPRLVGAMSLYVGDVLVAEELAQEALVRACERWSSVSEMAAPGVWVHRVAVNVAKSRFRRAAAERAPSTARSRSTFRASTQHSRWRCATRSPSYPTDNGRP